MFSNSHKEMNKQKALQRALSDLDITKVNELLSDEEIDVNKRDSTCGLQTVLMRMCHIHLDAHQRTCIINQILHKGAAVNIQDSSGRTALAHACIAERCDIIRALGDVFDCDPNIADTDGVTPLIYAVKSRKEHVVKAMLDTFTRGRIDVNHRTNKGVNALLEAESRFDSDICRLLIKEGGADPSQLDNAYQRGRAKSPRCATPEILPISPRPTNRKKHSRSRSTELLSPLIVHSRLSRSPDSCPCDLNPLCQSDIKLESTLYMKKAHSFESMSTTDCESESSLQDVQEVEEEGTESQPSMSTRGRRNSLSLPDLRDVSTNLVASPQASPRGNEKYPNHIPRYERSLTLEERISPLPQLSEEDESPISPPPLTRLNRRRGSVSLPDLRDCQTSLVGSKPHEDEEEEEGIRHLGEEPNIKSDKFYNKEINSSRRKTISVKLPSLIGTNHNDDQCKGRDKYTMKSEGRSKRQTCQAKNKHSNKHRAETQH